MSDWTDFVGVILVYFKFQVPSVLFCLFLYEVNNIVFDCLLSSM